MRQICYFPMTPMKNETEVSGVRAISHPSLLHPDFFMTIMGFQAVNGE